VDTLFGLVSILPMPVWGAMLLFPGTEFTRRLVSASWPLIALAGVYLTLLVVALFAGGGVGSLSFDALRAGLSSEWGFLVAWTHMLALDLFAGIWIFRDAKYWDISPTWFLVGTLMAGPLGLGIYLWFRSRRDRNDPVRLLN
jgi:uncharacterized membrane protein YczE